MLKFFSLLQITPKFKTQVTVFSIMFTGFTLGWYKGKYINSQYSNINSQKLIPYQNQDQVNTLIQQTQTPVIIYYYLPAIKQHSFFRQMMFKYSNIYHKQCHFMMVNLTKKFQQSKTIFDMQYPTRVKLQIRYPKGKVMYKITGKDQLIQGVGNRREGYRFNYTEEGFKKFLEYYKIRKGVEPVGSVLDVTNKALFGKIKEENVNLIKINQ